MKIEELENVSTNIFAGYTQRYCVQCSRFLSNRYGFCKGSVPERCRTTEGGFCI